MDRNQVYAAQLGALKGYGESDTYNPAPPSLIAATIADVNSLQNLAGDVLAILSGLNDRLLGPSPRAVSGGLAGNAAKPAGEFHALNDSIEGLRSILAQVRDEAQNLGSRL